MKVQDIRSFFKSPKNSQTDAASGSPTTVEVPSKLSRAGRRPPSAAAAAGSSSSPATEDKSEKKGKKKARAEEEDDSEDPIPKAAKKPKTNGSKREDEQSSKTSKKDSVVEKDRVKQKVKDVVDIDDDESPIPKSKKAGSKPEESKKPAASTKPDMKEGKDKKRESMSPSPRKSLRLQSTPDSSKKQQGRDQLDSTPASAKRGSKVDTSKRRLNLDDDDDDEEDPIPKTAKAKTATSRKARPLKIESDSDSDQEIIKGTPSPIKKKAAAPVAKPAISPKKSEFKEPPKPKHSEKKTIPPVKAEQVTPKASTSSKSHRTPETKVTPDKKPIDAKTPEEKKAAQKSNYFKMLSRGGPKNLGSKEVPTGADGCLNGLTIVQTGVLDSFEHDDIKNIIEKYGGRMTSAVSRKTSYLLMGNEPGETKKKKAKDLGVPIIGEDDFLELIRKSNPDGQSQSQTVFGIDDNENEVEEEEVKVKVEKIPSPKKKAESPKKKGTKAVQEEIKKPKDKSRSPERKHKPEMKGESQESSSTASSSTSGTNFSSISSTSPAFFEETWVEKYRPKTLRNLVGQTGDRSNANKLLKWLRNWFMYHGKSDDKAKASWPGLKDPDGKLFKAALLSGPPGIGKTTMAHLVCKEVGLDYIELNASDTRNKRGLHEILTDLLSSKSLNDIQSKTNELSNMARKHVLIMDEVDGMSGNEDRGGIQELIALIKSSRIPIICICNDRNHQKIRSLANYCFDLRCSKPTIEQLKGFIQSLCFKEKMKIPYDSVMKLVKSTDFDIRQIINQLQLLKETDPDNQTVYNPRKDIVLGPWDVVRKVFSETEHVGMTLQDKNNLFFQDYSFGPLFVQENYTKWEPAKARGDKYKTLDLVRDAAESIATGDLVDNVLRRTNNWSLLPTQAIFASILPGEIMEGKPCDGIEFPRWLGKNSNRNKVSRILQQLHTHVHLQVSGSLEALNLDYLPYLRRSIFNPLVAGDVDESAKVMQDYDLLREDLDNINELTLWPGMRNPLERVDAKTKASFTRQVNKEILPYSVVKVAKGKGKGKAGDEDELEGLEGEEGEAAAVEEEEEESPETDAMIKKKTRSKATAGSSKAKPKAGKASTSKPKSKNKKTRGDSDDEDELDAYESDFIDDSDENSDEDLQVRKKSSSKKRKGEESKQPGNKAKKIRK